MTEFILHRTVLFERSGGRPAGKEAKPVKYQKPEIMPAADATAVIQGTKAVGMWDNVDPTNPVRSASAYDADE